MQLLDRRIDVPDGKRDFPAYLDSNRFLSNLPGTTILFPVVDLSRQYINGLMYLLTQPEGARPTIVDDRNFYRSAGVKKWVQIGLPERGHQGAARRDLGDADADRGRPAAAEPDADRGRDGPRRLDPRLDRAAGAAGRPEVPQAATAACWASTGASRAGSRPTCCAGTCRCRRYANLRAQPRRAAPQGRAPDQGHVPAELRDDGGGRRRGDRRTSSARTASTRTTALFARIYTRRVRRALPRARRATTPPT